MDYDPQIAVILVNKRINDKFFQADGSNPASGSVICDKISTQNYFEFLLMAQYVT